MLLPVVREPRAPPQRLEPEPDPLWLGGVVHEALDRLYPDPPGEDAIPRPADLAVWRARFNEILDEVVAGERVGRDARSTARAGPAPPPGGGVPRRRRPPASTVLRPRAGPARAWVRLRRRGGRPGVSSCSAISRCAAASTGSTSSRAARGHLCATTRRRGRSPADQDRQRGQAPAPALHAGRSGAPWPGSDRRLLAAGRLRRPQAPRHRAKARGGRGGRAAPGLPLSVKGDDSVGPRSSRRRSVTPEGEGDRQRHEDARRRHHARPARRQVPRVLQFQPICRLERALGLEDESGGGNGG